MENKELRLGDIIDLIEKLKNDKGCLGGRLRDVKILISNDADEVSYHKARRISTMFLLDEIMEHQDYILID